MTELLLEGGGGGGGGRQATRTPDSLFSQDYVEIVFGVCEGPIGGLKAGTHGPLENFLVGETPVQNPSTGDSNFNDFKVTQRRGRDDDPEIVRVLGGDTSNLVVGVTTAQGIPVVRTTPSSQRKTVDGTGIDRLEVRLLFNQLFRTDENGDYEHTARFSIEYKASNSATWLFYKGETESTIYGKTTSGAVKDFLIDVTPLTDADYDIRVTKHSPDASTTEFVEITWESVQMVKLGNNQYPGLASIHLYARVTDQFSSLPDMSGIFNGMEIDVPSNYNSEARTYDEGTPWNGTFKKAFTSNPAWILYYLLMSPDHGLAHYYKNVATNRYEFYTAGKWCDEPVPAAVTGVTQPRFTFNELIDSRRLGLETLYYIAGSFNSTIYDAADGVIRLRTDQYRTPKQIFTPENLLKDGRFSYSMTDISTRYNDVLVRFANPDFGWQEDQRKASIDATDWQNENGIIPLDFFAVGCTDAHEAIRRANDRLLTANREVTTVSFVTNRFGVTTEPYDIVYIADPTSGWSTGGRIKSMGSGVIQLRDPIYFQAITPATMKIQTYTGIVELTVQPVLVGLNYSLNVTAGSIPTNVPDRTVFTLEDNPNFGFCKPFRVVTIGEVNNNAEAYRLTCLEVNPTKYEDSANGTVSDPVIYDTSTVGVPKLPDSFLVENVPPLITSDGSLTYRLRVSWKRPALANTQYYEIDYTEVDSGTWTTVRTYTDDAMLQPIKDGKLYTIRLFAVNPLGIRSTKFLEAANQYVLGKSGTLEDVQNFSVTRATTGWLAKWNDPLSLPDWDGVILKIGDVGVAWATLPILYKIKAKEQILPWFLPGLHRVSAKHTDTSKNESGDVVGVTLNILAPAQPLVNGRAERSLAVLTWQNCETSQPIKEYQLRVGATWDTAVEIGRLMGTTFSRSETVPGTKRYWVMAVDAAGNESQRGYVQVTVLSSITEIIGELTEGLDEVISTLTDPKKGLDATRLLAEAAEQQIAILQIQRSTETEALAQTTLKSQLEQYNDDKIQTKALAVARQTLETSISVINGLVTAEAESRIELVAQVNAFIASASESLSVLVSETGYMRAQYVLKLTVGGKVSGIVLNNETGMPTTMIVLSDKFAIANQDDEGNVIYPFVVGTVDGVSTVAINGLLVVDGTILARHIDVDSLSALAANLGEVTAGLLRNADSSIVFNLNATGTDVVLKVGDAISILADGTATFGGTLTADAFITTDNIELGAVTVTAAATLATDTDLSTGPTLASTTVNTQGYPLYIISQVTATETTSDDSGESTYAAASLVVNGTTVRTWHRYYTSDTGFELRATFFYFDPSSPTGDITVALIGSSGTNLLAEANGSSLLAIGLKR